MVRILKFFCLWMVVALAAERAPGFSLLGPYQTYHTTEMFYRNGDVGGPHNLGEEFRRNTPVLYYTYDETFLNFFGASGVAAVEEAIAMLNSITNLSSYSTDLSEFPMETTAFNYKAQALGLTDLKSRVLNTLIEQLGLADAERYVWTLRDRDPIPGSSCPIMEYLVIQRNYDPVTSALDQLQTSSYVNGTYYSYYILELCNGTFQSDAVEFPVDPLANSFTSVSGHYNQLSVGGYYTGLTRDDVAGLRYLMRTNNINIENAGTNTITFITNSAPQYLFTSNLFEFVSAALTNDAPGLIALFPSLQIGSTTPVFTNVITTNVIFYFTNYPFEPASAQPHLVSTQVLETNALVYFNHTFLNAYVTPNNPVVSNFQVPSVPGHSSATGTVFTITTNISGSACGPFAPAGSVCTNISMTPKVGIGPFGDFYILPTNFCAVSIVSTQLVKGISITNPPSGVIVVLTNSSGAIVDTNQFFSQNEVYSYNQYVYVVNPVTCPQDYTDRRQGIDRIRFVRYDGAFDPLTGLYGFPITNQYTLTAMPLTNPTPIVQTVRRFIRSPDILFSAMDLTTEESIGVRGGQYALSGFGVLDVLRGPATLNYATANVLPNVNGPGTITPGAGVLSSGSELVFNSTGPVFGNIYAFNLDELTQQKLFAWGSFDGSTNNPVVYPNGTSIENYELSKFVNVTPVYLPEGYVTSAPGHTNY
jgi:hypothetical protein